MNKQEIKCPGQGCGYVTKNALVEPTLKSMGVINGGKQAVKFRCPKCDKQLGFLAPEGFRCK